jgi:hypothetical protein
MVEGDSELRFATSFRRSRRVFVFVSVVVAFVAVVVVRGGNEVFDPRLKQWVFAWDLGFNADVDLMIGWAGDDGGGFGG